MNGSKIDLVPVFIFVAALPTDFSTLPTARLIVLEFLCTARACFFKPIALKPLVRAAEPKLKILAALYIAKPAANADPPIIVKSKPMPPNISKNFIRGPEVKFLIVSFIWLRA